MTDKAQYKLMNTKFPYGMGNVQHRFELPKMVIISDCKNPETANLYTANNTAEIQNVNNYYSFGMPMHRRNYTSGAGAYRFGFNGKEKDNEVKGEGAQYDYGFRIYDSRLGKFLSIDPLSKKYPWYTPYQFAGNKPIWCIDIEGLEEYIRTYVYDNGNVTFLKMERNVEFKPRSYTDKGKTVYSQSFYDKYNKATGQLFGSWEEGKVQYKYVTPDGKPLNIRRNKEGEYVSGDNEIMELKMNNLFGSIYIGPTNPEFSGKTTKEKADYRREPQDLVDAAAMQHDKDYDKVDAAGFIGACIQEKTIPADMALITRCIDVIKRARAGEIDPYTNKKISTATVERADAIVSAFTLLVANKSIMNLKKLP